MSEVILKNRILGYHYTNASKQDKQLFLLLSISETESYLFNIVFPKCRISYVFLFNNPDDENKVYLSGKAANTLKDAMDQQFFESRIPLMMVGVVDPSEKSINFMTEDSQDVNFDSLLFNSDCTPTKDEIIFEATIRQAVLDGNASTKYKLFGVDGPIASDLLQKIIDELIALGNQSVFVVIRTTDTLTFHPPIPFRTGQEAVDYLRKFGKPIESVVYIYGQ